MRHEPFIVAHYLNVMYNLMHIILHNFQHDSVQMVHCSRVAESFSRFPATQPDASISTQFEILTTRLGVKQVTRKVFVPAAWFFCHIYPRFLITTDELYVRRQQFLQWSMFGRYKGKIATILPWWFPQVPVLPINNPSPISTQYRWANIAISIWIFAVAGHHSQ